MRTAALCASLAVVLSPCTAGAQSIPITESEALAQLSIDSPRARVVRAAVDVARVDVAAAGRWPNPTVIWDREAVAGVTEHMLMIAQPLPITGRRSLDIQTASALVDASSNRANDELRRLR